MLKQIALALLLSLVIIFFIKELAYVLHFITYAHGFTVKMMSKIFAGGKIGIIIRNTIALFLIPFIIAIIPTGIYWMVTRKEFKYFPHVLWISWIILATVLVIK